MYISVLAASPSVRDTLRAGKAKCPLFQSSTAFDDHRPKEKALYDAVQPITTFRFSPFPRP